MFLLDQYCKFDDILSSGASESAYLEIKLFKIWILEKKKDIYHLESFSIILSSFILLSVFKVVFNSIP